MPIALINGARLNYLQVEPQDGGRREDLLMVHGLATNMAFWYLPYAQAFAKRFRVTLFDLRGHGRSQTTASGYTPEALAADVRGLLDHLKIERAHFVAHSFGGVVTLNLAKLDPRRVASLVLADAHLSLARGRHQRWARRGLIQALLDRHGLGLDTRDPYFGFKLLGAAASLLLRETDLPQELQDLAGPIFGKQGRRTAKQWLDLMSSTQAEQELMADDGLPFDTLKTFRFPKLALYGAHSLALSSSDLLRGPWPHAHFQTVSDAGHFFPATRANEMIASCERFWDEIIVPASRPVAPKERSSPFWSLEEARARLATYVAAAKADAEPASG